MTVSDRAGSDGVGSEPQFRTSTFSGGGGCVAVAHHAGSGVAIRHSRDPRGPVLRFTAEEWAAFVAGVKAGEFDVQ